MRFEFMVGFVFVDMLYISYAGDFFVFDRLLVYYVTKVFSFVRIWISIELF